MHPGLDRLTPRERDALRLLAQGFDAKSAAVRLGMSVHTLNDRLRSARQKLEVSSSREAARLFARVDQESSIQSPPDLPPPDFLAPEQSRWPIRGKPRSMHSGPPHGPQAPGACSSRPESPSCCSCTAAFWLSTDEASPAPDTPPLVVGTSPRPGARIAPGQFDLSVTFDRPMIGDSYSYVEASPGTTPDCTWKPTVSRDQRTFVLRCTAVAGRRYQIGFNDPRYVNFRSTTGISATPYRLSFSVR